MRSLLDSIPDTQGLLSGSQYLRGFRRCARCLFFLGSPVACCAKHAGRIFTFLISCRYPGCAFPADALLSGWWLFLTSSGMHTHSLRTRPPGAWVRQRLKDPLPESGDYAVPCENLGRRQRTRVKHFGCPKPEG